MGAVAIGFAIGFVLGAGSGAAAGAFGGAVLGALLGGCVHAILWARAHSGNAPTIERHRVVCTPFGRPADIDFSGDLERKRWLDVERCSLLPGETHVSCDKGCVRRINDAGIRPGRLPIAAPDASHAHVR